MPTTSRTVSTIKQCACKPDFVFGSAASFKNHQKTACHKAYLIGREEAAEELRSNRIDIALENYNAQQEIARLRRKINTLTRALTEEYVD